MRKFIILLIVFCLQSNTLLADSAGRIFSKFIDPIVSSSISKQTFSDLNPADFIDPFTGALFVKQREFELPIRDQIRFYVSRYYLGPTERTKSELRSESWRWSFDAQIVKLGDTKLVFYSWDGQTYYYNIDDAGRYVNYEKGNRYINELAQGYSLEVGLVTYLFNDGGKLSSITGPLGNEIIFEYEGELLTRIKLYDWDNIYLEYDEQSKLTKITYPTGKVFSYDYDDDLITKVTDYWGNSIDYAYSDGLVTQMTTSMGLKIEYTYSSDLHGVVEKRIKNDVEITELSYSKSGQQITLLKQTTIDNQTASIRYTLKPDMWVITDELQNQHEIQWHDLHSLMPVRYQSPAGKAKQWKYNDRGQLESEFHVDSAAYYYEYNEHDQLISVLSPRGNTIQYEYNESKLLTEKKVNGQLIYQLNYNQQGLIENIVNSKERQLSIEYQLSAHPARITDNAGLSFKIAYDDFFRYRSVSMNDFSLFVFEYDDSNKIVQFSNKITENNIGLSVTEFNEPNESTVNTDAQIAYYYDEGNRLKSIADINKTNLFEFDDSGSLTKLISKQKNHEFEMDPEGKTIRMSDDSKTDIQLTYDKQGRLTTKQNSDGSTALFDYDDLNRLSSIKYDGVPLSGYLYNAENSLIRQVINDQQVDLLKDERNRLFLINSKSADLGAQDYKLNWRSDNQIEQIRYPSGLVADYSYDVSGRLESVTFDSNKTITINYPAIGIKQVNFPNKIVVDNYTNRFGKLKLARLSFGNKPIDHVSYQFNEIGQPVSVSLENVSLDQPSKKNYSFVPSGFLFPFYYAGDDDSLNSPLKKNYFNVEKTVKGTDPKFSEADLSRMRLINELLLRSISSGRTVDQSPTELLREISTPAVDILFSPDGNVLGFRTIDKSKWHYFHYYGQGLRAISNSNGKLVQRYDEILKPANQPAYSASFLTRGKTRNDYLLVGEDYETVFPIENSKVNFPADENEHNLLSKFIEDRTEAVVNLSFLEKKFAINSEKKIQFSQQANSAFNSVQKIVKRELEGIRTLIDNVVVSTNSKQWQTFIEADKNNIVLYVANNQQAETEEKSPETSKSDQKQNNQPDDNTNQQLKKQQISIPENADDKQEVTSVKEIDATAANEKNNLPKQPDSQSVSGLKSNGTTPQRIWLNDNQGGDDGASKTVRGN